ncbi:sulfate adenylyltransferase subunit 1 [Qipengyuania spongiae]|uniref:sulfate adenylyltransferase n=1 Tax=Qipengyuania spongiae TaxID=2909673 RepID=A0ABY5T0K2_9SPHN|nr:GTP-binding protein [Qipengyuania spongiae]UVI40282.1 GTP-binding protein [Qipengyuania spongiae]
MHGSATLPKVATAPDTASEEKDLLRFIVCGSVDDGKSTLIGRLLFETGSVPADQLETLAAESRRFGTQGASLDLSLLVDGLSAEREQGITIDVAYRYFSTAQRKFIVIDAPGHEEYTRNMVTGASQADMGVLLVDAQQGLTDQTRRHARVLKMLGVRHIVLAVNKMDRVRFLREVFDEVVGNFTRFTEDAEIGGFSAIPLAALTGANVTAPSAALSWYDGPPLLELLETIPVGADPASADAPFRMPVQLALRPNEDFRGFAGTIASGRIAVGDAVAIQPGGRTTSIARIVTFDGDLDAAGAGEAVVLVLADQVDCSRGDVIAAAGSAGAAVQGFAADLVWLNERGFDAACDYQIKIATRSLSVDLRFPQGQAPGLNDIVAAELTAARPIVAAIYASEPRLGAFILIDRESQATVAAGMIRELHEGAGQTSRRRGENIVWFDTVGNGRAENDIARIVDALSASGNRVAVIDDALLRADLCSDLSGPDEEWARRALAVARIAARTSATVLVASSAPLPVDASIQAISSPEEIAATWVI